MVQQKADTDARRHRQELACARKDKEEVGKLADALQVITSAAGCNALQRVDWGDAGYRLDAARA